MDQTFFDCIGNKMIEWVKMVDIIYYLIESRINTKIHHFAAKSGESLSDIMWNFWRNARENANHSVTFHQQVLQS